MGSFQTMFTSILKTSGRKMMIVKVVLPKIVYYGLPDILGQYLEACQSYQRKTQPEKFGVTPCISKSI